MESKAKISLNYLIFNAQRVKTTMLRTLKKIDFDKIERTEHYINQK